jgi:CRISPR-associated protein Csd2
MATDLHHRHDVLILFDVTDGNPNGDPDAGNMPRLDPTTNLGLVSDVCLKRKVRNFVELFPPAPDKGSGNRDRILIRQGAVIETEQKQAVGATEKAGDVPGDSHAERAKNWLCREFFDVRTFGGVLATGDQVLKGSAYGQVRGPVQFTFARSVDPVVPLEASITRCAVTKEEDAKKERTMGSKYLIPYGLYVGKAYVSPAFAENTGFTTRDLGVVFEALANLFEHDRSAARGEMVVRGVYDFEHVGTQAGANAEQNAREARLGCAHAHRLFETVQITHAPSMAGRAHPASFADYQVTVTFEEAAFPGVKLNRLVEATRPALVAAAAG